MLHQKNESTLNARASTSHLILLQKQRSVLASLKWMKPMIVISTFDGVELQVQNKKQQIKQEKKEKRQSFVNNYQSK